MVNFRKSSGFPFFCEYLDMYNASIDTRRISLHIKEMSDTKLYIAIQNIQIVEDSKQ